MNFLFSLKLQINKNNFHTYLSVKKKNHTFGTIENLLTPQHHVQICLHCNKANIRADIEW